MTLLGSPQVLILKVSLRYDPMELVDIELSTSYVCNIPKHLTELEARHEVEQVGDPVHPGSQFSIEEYFFDNGGLREDHVDQH